MTRIKPEEVVEELSFQFRRALSLAVTEILPGAQFDEHELFRAFRRAVHRKCNPWENIKDSSVEIDKS